MFEKFLVWTWENDIIAATLFQLIEMPVTTFDIPQHILDFIDELVDSGGVRNRREIVVRALENFIKLQMNKWNGSVIILYGVRQGLISSGSLRELLRGRTEEELYEIGRRMGQTLRDTALVSEGLDTTLPENHKAATQMLQVGGWGTYKVTDEQIIIAEPYLPSALIHGYLETALSLTLKRVETSEDVCVFDKGEHKGQYIQYIKQKT